MKNKTMIQFLPMVCWMGIIFYLSAQPAEESSELSIGVMQPLLQVTEKVMTIDEGLFHHLIRKGAHLTAYFILGILTMFAFEKVKSRLFHQGMIAFGICILYAISDEIHQLFVPGRSGELSDVGIDALGALLGILLYIALCKVFLQKRKLQT